ncbi:preprotein translocase, YajC subunit [[Clostridium] methylpentosum DSM 5476]|uniref:Preprotein translocase, YajC subunit n=1 Tax=[Clostridium] methylpentosum DSM 5476 TaxID=537013 RepID=C0EGU9_9FIRM|nr:preprotein translocase, YajC subunit [[Clostridium] methylpentosum DSM 5476]MDY3988586.1 preprotein translocase subunit YajC [Massilioclostridium sp.]
MNLSLLDQAAGQSGGMLSMAMPFIMLAVMFLIMYLLIIRPQKKRDKETQAMRNNIQVGDEVVTAGGIVGRVVNIKEDTIVLETGSDRSKIRIKRWAVQSNESLSNV